MSAASRPWPGHPGSTRRPGATRCAAVHRRSPPNRTDLLPNTTKGTATMKVVKHITPPAGLTRLLFRLPILVYRAGLGWLFGRRMLLLNHVGRVSGRPRHTVLEVVEHDPSEDSYVVASGWGAGAQWYRNIMRRPEVTVRVAQRTIPVTALPLTENDGAEIFARYASRHRRLAMQMLPRVLGVSVDGTDADFREVGRRMPFVRFVRRQ